MKLFVKVKETVIVTFSLLCEACREDARYIENTLTKFHIMLGDVEGSCGVVFSFWWK
jgi:hypothetical protein